MELVYGTHTKTLIVAHLEAAETLGTLTEGTGYIKVDATDPNYVELLKIDPNLETVLDPTEPRIKPPEPPVEPPVDPEGNGAKRSAKHAESDKHDAKHDDKHDAKHESGHGSHKK